MSGQRLFTRDFILDMGVSFCCSLNYFTLLINMVGFASVSFGATVAESGLAAGLYVIGGMISRVFLGKYIEMFGRKKMLITTLFLALIMSVVYFQVTSLMMLYAVRLLHGMAYGLSSASSTDIVAKLIPNERKGEGMGYFFLGITFANAIGPFLGLVLGNTGNYDNVFSVGVVMYSIALVLALFIRVPEETLDAKQIKNAKSFNLGNLLQLSAIPISLACAVFFLGYSGIMAFISDYSSEIGLYEAASFFYLAVAFGTFVSRISTGRRFDTFGANTVAIPAYCSFIVAMVIYSQTSMAALFIISGLMAGYGMSTIYTVCQTISIKQSPPHRYGVTTSTFAGITDIGSGLGPMTLGLLLPFMGYREMYLICAALGLVSMLMYFAVHGWSSRKQSPEKV